MEAKSDDIQVIKENRQEDPELASFDILKEWRNKNRNPESREALYLILMQATDKGLIDEREVQFLKEGP